MMKILNACSGEDAELFYPISYGPAAEKQIAEAKAVCARCPVSYRDACLDDAVRREDSEGIWGGTTPAERAGLYAPRETVVDRPELDEAVWKLRNMALPEIAKTLGVSLAVVRRCRARNKRQEAAR